MTTETGWAIKSDLGFYYGSFHRTRADAIGHYVQALESYRYWPTPSQHKEGWKRCYGNGDRVVKVRLAEIARRGAVG